MQFEPDDFKRLASEVRMFLDKADIMTRLSAMPVLYLELPDVGSMHKLHHEIVKAMAADFMAMHPSGLPYDYPDDHSIRFKPYAGVSVVLSCKQRFAVMAGGSVGYRDIVFKTLDDKF